MSIKHTVVKETKKRETVRQQAKRLNTSISKVRKLRQGTIKFSEVNS